MEPAVCAEGRVIQLGRTWHFLGLLDEMPFQQYGNGLTGLAATYVEWPREIYITLLKIKKTSVNQAFNSLCR